MKKKSAVVFLIAISCLILCSCKSKSAVSADDLILGIGEVTLDSEDCIVQAENAVNALKEKDYKQLEHLEELEIARATYNDLVDRDDAEQIVETINEIGDSISLDDNDVIQSARKAYNKGSDGAQKYVTNYEKLVTAEEELSNLKVSNTVNCIAAIGTVTLNSQPDILAAQAQYESLSHDEKERVSNAEVLTRANETFRDLKEEQQKREKAEKEQAAKRAIAKMSTSTDKVEGITWYQSPNQPYYANSRSYVLPYIGKNDSGVWLRLKFHYTGSDWIFWKDLTIMVDGEKYYKSYDYFEVNRDNGSGDVWEYVDISPSTDDINMLKAIVASKETIVRFQGDNYHYDLTVKSSDKTAISDVLAAYDALRGIY